MNRNLMNNSFQPLSHHFQVVIRHLVKQYRHIAPPVHPQYTQTQTIQQLKQHIKLLTQWYQVARWHNFTISVTWLCVAVSLRQKYEGK